MSKRRELDEAKNLWRWALRSLLIIPALAIGASAASGQELPPRSRPKPERSAAGAAAARVANSVIVPVTVKDSQGRLVGDLQKDEFRVFADGVEQKILQFTADPFPLSAVILIDNDLPQKQAEQVQKSLTTISARLRAERRSRAGDLQRVSHDRRADFSSNNDDLFTHLKRLEIGSHSSCHGHGSDFVPGPVINGNTTPGNTPPTGLGIPLHGSGRYQTDSALDDALYSAADMLKDRAGRPPQDYLPNFRRQQFPAEQAHFQRDACASFCASDVSVYSISVSHSSRFPLRSANRLWSAGWRNCRSTRREPAATHSTRRNKPNSSDFIRTLRKKRAINTRSRFSRMAWTRDHDFHPIEVRVRRPGLNILTRQGYYESGIGR